MKKLILYISVLGSFAAIWSCADKKGNAQARVISIADLALEAKLQNANSKMMDSAWLAEVRLLREMDRTVHNFAASSSQPTGYQLMSLSCCACGTGCCNVCDTLSNRAYMSSLQVQGISLTSQSAEMKSMSFVPTTVDNLKVFDLNSKIPDGKYLLTIETSLPLKKISFPIMVQGKELTLTNESGLK
jgi:anti-sigma28 factor (negative regulator of flagellin synthesis)